MSNKYRDLIEELSDRELMINFYATQVLLIVVSIILGFILFDHVSSFFSIFDWDDVRILTYGGTAGIGVVLLDYLLMKVVPPSYYDDGGLNEKFFRGKSFWKIAGIAGIVAVNEEVLFRGVIQTHFGIVIASAIFVLVHYRYLFHWFLFLSIIALSFLIGYLYLVTGNLLVTIFMHFIIDFLEGVLINLKKDRTPKMRRDDL